jgi:hypothetical protein
MLQLLQYFVGTSIAALREAADTTMVHSVVEGPTFNGSSLGFDGGNGCKLRGRIPGSVRDPWKKEDIQIKKR